MPPYGMLRIFVTGATLYLAAISVSDARSECLFNALGLDTVLSVQKACREYCIRADACMRRNLTTLSGGACQCMCEAHVTPPSQLLTICARR